MRFNLKLIRDHADVNDQTVYLDEPHERVVGEEFGAAELRVQARLDELRARRRAVSLDLSRLEFMDSSGVHLLVQAFHDASGDGWGFRIEPGVSRQVMRLI